MKNKNPVIHFEMPATDQGRIEKFYQEVFGWETKHLGEEMGNYILAITADVDPETQMPVHPGTINGGFYSVPENMAAQCPVIVIRVDDINSAVEDIEKAGGTIKVKPMIIPGIGVYASFSDTEDNLVSILELSEEKKRELDLIQNVEIRRH